MTTCTKLYTDIPFAHRQPNHRGHCAMLHGHNWSFKFEFTAKYKDKCGFVVDFGQLHRLKELLLTLDHRLVLNADDPALEHFKEHLCPNRSDKPGYAYIMVVADCSCEGMAEWALEHGSRLVEDMTLGRVTVKRVTCYEDSKNSATATKALQ